MDLSDSTISSPMPSPSPSLSESENRFFHSDRQLVLQPRIDSAFKQIKSFGGNIYISNQIFRYFFSKMKGLSFEMGPLGF